MSGIKTRSAAKSLVTSNLPSGTGGISATNHRAVENSILDSAILYGEAEVRVIDMTTTAPPGSPSDRDAYIIADSATGDWSGHDGKVAIWDASVSPAAWVIYTPALGWSAYDLDGETAYRHDGSDWVEVSSGGSSAFELIVAVSDETTALTTGTAKVTFRMPDAVTLTAVRASVTTAPTGDTLTVDINEGGASILSTKLTIDAGEKTSTTAATPAVISDSSLADDAEMTIDIDGVGSTIAGAGLKVTLIGTRT